MKQKKIFLEGEGDSWFNRNHEELKKKDFSFDPVVISLKKITEGFNKKINVLEVGCGDGGRLSYLRDELDIQVAGIDPSAKAVSHAHEKGIDCHVGTADNLPFDEKSFDVIVFGFCLYLCDQEDLFKIAFDADKVLKGDGWIIINDFYSSGLYKAAYHHREGVSTHKMDYSKMFLWHPEYSCFHHDIYHHDTNKFTDSARDWVGISVLRKSKNENA